MYSSIINKYLYIFSFVFIICCIAAVYYQQPLLIGVSFVVLISYWLLLNPPMLLYVLVATIPWSIEYGLGSLSTDLPDEPLMLLTALAVIVMLVYNKGIGFRNIPLIIWLLILQFVWLIVTVLFSTDFLVSVKYLLAKSWYLLAFVAAPILFLRKKKQLIAATLVLFVSMTVFVCLTMWRHAENGFTFDTINPSLEPFFRNHVNYSALLVFMFPILFAVRFLVQQKRIKWLLDVVFIVLLAALYFSYARGAWLAFIIGGLTFILLKKKFLVHAYVLAIFAALFLTLWLVRNDKYVDYAHDYNTTIFHENFQDHLVATYQFRDVSTAERFYRWVAGVRMIKDAWKTGFGPTTFYLNYRSYTVPAYKTWVSKNEDRSTVHNYFLLIIVEQGVIGLVLLLILIGFMFYKAQQLYSKSDDRFWRITGGVIAIVLVMICTVNLLSDLIETDKVGSIFYLCLAVLVISDLRKRKLAVVV